MAAPIALVVGLGNPGDKYDRTRHNVGFWFLDALAERYQTSFRHQSKLNGELASARSANGPFYLAKPTTFMNLSGNCVSAVANYYRIEPANVLVVHDELDLDAGTVRLKIGGGHGGHNGLRDITQHIGKDFARLRIGVGDPAHPKRGANFVLSVPPAAQMEAIESAMQSVLGEFDAVLNGDIQKAMNTFNRRA